MQAQAFFNGTRARECLKVACKVATQGTLLKELAHQAIQKGTREWA